MDDIVDGAHSALDGGVYSESLGEIITVRGRNDFEMNSLFANALVELNIVRPSAGDAITEVAASLIVPIAESQYKPIEICTIAYHFRNRVNYYIRSRQDPPWGPIHELIDFYYRYDDSGEDHDIIDTECIAFATQWSQRYWRSILEPAWLTATVQSIAAAIYADRAFDRLPILADALEEAGCTNADVLLHCRQPAEHVRGCWVVDLMLGRE